MKRLYPDPNNLYPIDGITRTVFLKNIIKNSNIIVGDYTYYDDPQDIHNFEQNILYHFDFNGDKLIIGKFCQIASNCRFIMNGAIHAIDGISTYPFKIFGKACKDAPLNFKHKGDTVIGNDVWIGNSVTFLPGVKVGDGAIIGANSVVTKDVEPYTIIAGNPAKIIRKRFDDQAIEFLSALCWWDWDIEKITNHINLISSGNIEDLKKL